MAHPYRFSRPYVGALIFGCSVLLAQQASAGSDEVSEEARTHFREGVSELSSASPDYAQAYDSFRAAYRESPSWKVLGNLGIAAMHLERDGEALEAFERYLREGRPSLSEEEISQFEADIALLKENIAWVSLELPESAQALSDLRVSSLGDRRNEYVLGGPSLRLGVRSGVHVFELQLEDGSVRSWRVELEAGQKAEHRFLLAEDPAEESQSSLAGANPQDVEPSRPVPTSVYVGLASTAALAIGAGVTGGFALKKNNEFESINDGSQPEEAEAARDSAKTLGLVSDIMWGATLASAGVTAVLYFTRPTEPRDAAALTWTPVVGPKTWALSVSGAF